MFTYAQLKCVEKENDFTWFLVTEKNNESFEEELKEKYLLSVLNSLGKKKWELVSIDPSIGFILKKKNKLF